jgi:predicted DNA-binding protein YlxM (UPF0122 family)
MSLEFSKKLKHNTLLESFKAHDIAYYECIKTTAQWFKDIPQEIEMLAESKPREFLLQSRELHVSASIRYTVTSLNDDDHLSDDRSSDGDKSADFQIDSD